MVEDEENMVESEDDSEEVEDDGTETSEVKKESSEEPKEEKKVDTFNREMYTAVCADCGKSCEVPFKPTEGRPVYCRDCYRKHVPQRRRF
jgi:CxxC-x17-CxxC domain-containing protein